MGEGWNPTTGYAWGCTNPVGWVPYPREVPRRHPLLDSVGRIDDPCARPAHHPPDFAPTPKFKPPREGYPNNICNLDDYAAAREAEENGGEPEEALATLNIAQGTPAGFTMKVKVQPVFNTATVLTDPPTLEQCCQDARELDTLRDEVEKTVGPQEVLESGMKRWAKCMSPCGPRLPGYPCRGVIRSPRAEWLKQDAKSKCKPSFVSTREAGPDDAKPLTGREFVEGKRTCDLYPIQAKLPPRFNNAEWFKGYGCETWAHPFYLTTSKDYGRFPPTAHTMTQAYYPMECKFTDRIAVTGMPRNRSLNLTSNKTIV